MEKPDEQEDSAQRSAEEPESEDQQQEKEEDQPSEEEQEQDIEQLKDKLIAKAKNEASNEAEEESKDKPKTFKELGVTQHAHSCPLLPENIFSPFSWKWGEPSPPTQALVLGSVCWPFADFRPFLNVLMVIAGWWLRSAMRSAWPAKG